MCRWIAYTGSPVRLEEVVTKPARSLVHQSLHAAQCKTATNGDGFGIGWYGDREIPGVYREIAPAWSDPNLQSLCAQLKAQTFLAHVRAATVAGTSRDNCHPFSVGPWLFMHNGQIGEFAKVRRRVEAMIPDSLYKHRRGGTDSEAIFLIALATIENEGPASAIAQTLARVQDEMAAAGVDEALRFAAALTDGKQLTVFRYSSDPLPPSVWFRRTDDATTVVSEPIDDNDLGWQALPANHVLQTPCAGLSGEMTIRSMEAVSGLEVYAMDVEAADMKPASAPSASETFGSTANPVADPIAGGQGRVVKPSIKHPRAEVPRTPHPRLVDPRVADPRVADPVS